MGEVTHTKAPPPPLPTSAPLPLYRRPTLRDYMHQAFRNAPQALMLGITAVGQHVVIPSIMAFRGVSSLRMVDNSSGRRL